MEGGLCVCCGLVAWGCVFLLLGGRRNVPSGGHRFATYIRGSVVRFASNSWVASQLLEIEPWGYACDELATATVGFFGTALSRREASGFALATLLASPVVGLVVSRSLVGALGLAGACLAFLMIQGTSAQRNRKKELSQEMPGVFRTLAVALGSGQTLAQAIAYVGSHEKGPAAQGFSMASLRLRCGGSAESVLGTLATELDAPGMGLLVTALTISQRTGSPLKDLFQHSARLVEREQGLNRELAVKTAQVRMSAKVVCLLPLLMVMLLSLISPDFQEGVTTPLGMGCLALAVVMDVVAILIMRRLMKGVV